jgi:hypothetical protein
MSTVSAAGLISGYRQRHPNLLASFTSRFHLPRERGVAGTAAAHPAA